MEPGHWGQLWRGEENFQLGKRNFSRLHGVLNNTRTHLHFLLISGSLLEICILFVLKIISSLTGSLFTLFIIIVPKWEFSISGCVSYYSDHLWQSILDNHSGADAGFGTVLVHRGLSKLVQSACSDDNHNGRFASGEGITLCCTYTMVHKWHKALMGEGVNDFVFKPYCTTKKY